VDGWNRVAELERAMPGSKPEQVFVAMWFDDTMAAAYDEGIKKAIEEAGYQALRIDKQEHNNLIDDEIIAQIRQSRVVVADFTGQRAGVYYEAGFARGLGIEVVPTVRHDAMQECHFDTNHLNHVVWTSPADLRERLRNRLLATVGRGPLSGDG
jgi:nucleoside 2-deoxyribosyltransferase